MMTPKVFFYILCIFGITGCLQVAEDRAVIEDQIGQASQDGLHFQVANGASALRQIQQQEGVLAIDLWAQRPTQQLSITPYPDPTLELPKEVRVTWHNLMPNSEISFQSTTGVGLEYQRIQTRNKPNTLFTLHTSFPKEGLALTITPEEPLEGESWQIGVFADVQERLNGLSDLLIPLAQESVRFCLISGDLTSQGQTHELKIFQQGLENHLPFPCYATLGNHELGTKGLPFYRFFGRGSDSFVYGGSRITLLDDASATLAPRTRKKLNQWLEAGRDQLHLVVTHLPILDADGTRSGAFANRLEASELLASLAEGRIDLLLYGHVHTFKSFRQAGIPALISGGGGSIPMRFDGIGRHYVLLELDPKKQVIAHRVQEISPEE